MTKILKPPFSRRTALAKVRAAQDPRNNRDPERVVLAYRENSSWRNREHFFSERDAIRAVLNEKWTTELDYQLKKDLWSFTDNRISVRFEHECRNSKKQWFRSYGNEQWEFDPDGLMCRHEASINDTPIGEQNRRLPRTC